MRTSRSTATSSRWAADSPIRLGVLVGYVAGKPLCIVGTALLVSWLSRGRLRPTAGWRAVAGAGASAGVGIGFTVSLLVATPAFDGAQLEEAEEAKAGILLSAARTLVECRDFECPYPGRAERAVRELLRDFAGVPYVWRHLPLADVHPHAELAALASEAAADQGAFWQMRDQLIEYRDKLRMADLVQYADRLRLDVARLTEDLQGHVGRSGPPATWRART